METSGDLTLHCWARFEQRSEEHSAAASCWAALDWLFGGLVISRNFSPHPARRRELSGQLLGGGLWAEWYCVASYRVFPGDSDSKESALNSGDPDSIPGSGRSSGEGIGNPL